MRIALEGQVEEVDHGVCSSARGGIARRHDAPQRIQHFHVHQVGRVEIEGMLAERGRDRLTAGRPSRLLRRASATRAARSFNERWSSSVATLSRLLAAMGERLDLRAVPGPRSNASDGELRTDFEQLTPGERVAQTAALSRVATGLAAGGD